MRRRIFLDVGGHLGETLAVAVQPRWRFDRIWTFEPASECLPALRALADERVEVVPAGWWSSDTTLDLHEPGHLGASAATGTRRAGGAVETCRFIDAARWMAENIESTDTVWMKVNIEAAEVEVLRRLLDTGEIAKVDHLVVHFDIERVVDDQEHQADDMRRRLSEAGVSYREAPEVMFGRTRAAKTENWLAWTEAGRIERFRYVGARRAIHSARRQVFRVRRYLRR